jgi:hypothetical protein
MDLAREKRGRQRRQRLSFVKIILVAPAEECRRLQIDPTKRAKSPIPSIGDPAQGLFKLPNDLLGLERR